MSPASTPPEPITGIDFLANNAELGGGEVMLVRMAEAARELGIDVRVVGPDFAAGLGDAATGLGLPFLPVPGRDRRGYGMHLARLARSWHTRLVWCNGLVPGVATATCRAPRVIHLHQRPTHRQAGALNWFELRTIALVVPSPFLGRQLPRSRVLENWTEDAAPNGRRVLTSDPVRVGFIGRLSPSKGVDVLADALAILERRHPGGFTLVVAGDDRLVPSHEAAAVRSHLEAGAVPITALGWIDPDAFFAQVDIAVVPSVWPEPFGLVAAQALAHQVPLVVTDAGALPDIVGEGHPWIAPPADAGALAAVIEDLVADPGRAADVARAGRHRWEERFSPRSGHQRFADLLGDLGVALPGRAAEPASVGAHT